VILRFAFDYLQRNGEGSASERNWLRDETGGSIYLRLSTRPGRADPAGYNGELRRDIIDGAYWMRPPGPNAQIVVAYTGAVATEAIQAIGLMAEDRRDVGLLAITSADRLNAGWSAAQRARERGLVNARSHIERLLADLPLHCGLVTVIDGHPAALAWVGSVRGHCVRALGVEHFGQTGTIADLYRHFGIDAKRSWRLPRPLLQAVLSATCVRFFSRTGAPAPLGPRALSRNETKAAGAEVERGESCLKDRFEWYTSDLKVQPSPAGSCA
jgi:pyruvate dehydrogenase E1 component